VASRLAAAFGWTVSQDYGAFAEVTTGSVLHGNRPSDGVARAVIYYPVR